MIEKRLPEELIADVVLQEFEVYRRELMYKDIANLRPILSRAILKTRESVINECMDCLKTYHSKEVLKRIYQRLMRQW